MSCEVRNLKLMVSGGWADVFRENVSLRALLVLLYIFPLDFNLCSLPTLLCVLECISRYLKNNLPFCCCCFPWEGWSKYTMLSEWKYPVHSCKSHSEPHKRMFSMVPPGPVPNPCNPESPVGFFFLVWQEEIIAWDVLATRRAHSSLSNFPVSVHRTLTGVVRSCNTCSSFTHFQWSIFFP